MDELFKNFEPQTVKDMIELLFSGYIGSGICDLETLPDVYDFKKIIEAEADRRQIEIDNSKKEKENAII